MCEIRPDGGIHNGNTNDRPDANSCGCGSAIKAPPVDHSRDLLRMRLLEIPGSDEQIDVKIEFVRKVNGDQAMFLMGTAVRGIVQGAHKFGAAMGLSGEEINNILFGVDEPTFEEIEEERARRESDEELRAGD